MKTCAFLLVLIFPAISFSAEDDSLKAYLEEINKVAARVNEATHEKTLVQQIDALDNLSQEYLDNYQVYDMFLQQIGTTHSFAGQHHKALIAFDRHRSFNDPIIEAVITLQSKDAIDAILEKSAEHQIVMINEAHHVAQHRVLTYRLLGALWRQGFRYFAAETFIMDAEVLIKGDVLPLGAGYYTQEPTFANLVFHAKSLGFQLVSYDYGSDRSTGTAGREQIAAQHIREKIFDSDPDAKLVMHVGYGHINEEEWLAHNLKRDLEMDPLTIDQTSISEKSELQYEPETYSWIVENLKFEYPIVLVDGENEIWSSDKNEHDISVIWPRTQYEMGRPDWARLGRDHLVIDTQWCKESFPCTVEVFRLADADEVPLDRVIVAEPEEVAVVFINNGRNVISVTGSDGKEVFRQTIYH